MHLIWLLQHHHVDLLPPIVPGLRVVVPGLQDGVEHLLYQHGEGLEGHIYIANVVLVRTKGPDSKT